MAQNTAKIDSDLLKRIKNIIKKKSKKIRYSSSKQFIDIAVLELIEKEEKKD